jgi:hypothetical protein
LENGNKVKGNVGKVQPEFLEDLSIDKELAQYFRFAWFGRSGGGGGPERALSERVA